MTLRPLILILAAALGLAACARGDGQATSLRDMRPVGTRPQEFSIVPRAELQIPPDLAALPQPGTPNRAERDPLAEVTAALGGQPAARRGDGRTPATDAALLAQVGRFGTDPQIRQTLAAEDLAFRKRNSRFTWSLFPRDNYARAYRRQLLDPSRTARYFRLQGVRTPAQPPS